MIGGIRMTSQLRAREKGYLRVLERRADWLARRVAQMPKEERGATDMDKWELRALNWAIGELRSLTEGNFLQKQTKATKAEFGNPVIADSR